MQKAFLLLVVFSISFCLKSVGQSITTMISLNDSTYKNFIEIDTSSKFRWQVAKTQKSFFNASSPVLVTDSIKTYPKNDTTRFILKFDSLHYLNSSYVSGFISRIWLTFDQNILTDSLKDFCKIEFSSDSGKHWNTGISDGCLVFINNTSCCSDSSVYSGKHELKSVQFILIPCGCPARLKNNQYVFNIQNSVWYRFSLISDSIFDSLPGWMIWDISIQRDFVSGCPSGIENISSQIPIKISPNPSSSNFNLTTDETIAEKGFDISVTNVLGENIFSKNEIHQANFKIDTQQFPAGIYFLKSHCSGYADANEKIVIEK